MENLHLALENDKYIKKNCCADILYLSKLPVFPMVELQGYTELRYFNIMVVPVEIYQVTGEGPMKKIRFVFLKLYYCRFL